MQVNRTEDRYINREVVAAANVGYVPGDPSTYLDMPFTNGPRLYDDGAIRECAAAGANFGSPATSVGQWSIIGSLPCAAPPQLADYNQANPSVCNLQRGPDGRWRLQCQSNIVTV